MKRRSRLYHKLLKRFYGICFFFGKCLPLTMSFIILRKSISFIEILPVTSGQDFCRVGAMENSQSDHQEYRIKACWATAVLSMWKMELTLPVLWTFWMIMESGKSVNILHPCLKLASFLSTCLALQLF